MQILIALCSNILKTITVMIFGGPWWCYHIMVEGRVYDACAQTLTRFNKIAIQGTPQMAVD